MLGAILVVAESERPHPGASYGRCLSLEDSPDNKAVAEQVVIVIAPMARGSASRCAFEDEVILFHRGSPIFSCPAPTVFEAERISNTATKDSVCGARYPPY